MKKFRFPPLRFFFTFIFIFSLFPGAILAQETDSANAPNAPTSKSAEDTVKAENQFDFWLGEWELRWAEDRKGINTITKILDGRVIKESFDGRPSMNLVGQSYSVYVEPLGLWKQTWVDNEGSYLDFTGGFKDGRMTLSREAIRDGKKFLQRMVWHNIEKDRFDWNWERSDDQGATWKTVWKIHYTRK